MNNEEINEKKEDAILRILKLLIMSMIVCVPLLLSLFVMKITDFSIFGILSAAFFIFLSFALSIMFYCMDVDEEVEDE